MLCCSIRSFSDFFLPCVYVCVFLNFFITLHNRRECVCMHPFACSWTCPLYCITNAVRVCVHVFLDLPITLHNKPGEISFSKHQFAKRSMLVYFTVYKKTSCIRFVYKVSLQTTLGWVNRATCCHLLHGQPLLLGDDCSKKRTTVSLLNESTGCFLVTRHRLTCCKR